MVFRVFHNFPTPADQTGDLDYIVLWYFSPANQISVLYGKVKTSHSATQISDRGEYPKYAEFNI